MAKTTTLLVPIHPGEILLEDFMKPLQISINRLARDLNVPPNRVHSIVHGNRAITADTALRLSVYFGVSAQTWLNLQAEYDLRVTMRTLGKEIRRTVRRRDAAYAPTRAGNSLRISLTNALASPKSIRVLSM
jgi:addiction module HigA family antidote